ncbi:MAG: hypothetical protein H7833_03700 [Magnetococcus sp. DMHC-1]|nr:hypothetical protein [Magnetococcales bacterium]
MAFPSDEELQKMYGHVFADPVITAISNWREENEDDIVDEEEYLEKAEKNVKAFTAKLDEVFGKILSRGTGENP